MASIIVILKTKLNSSAFRAVVTSFMIMNEAMKLEKKKISHTTGLNWIHKIGYYELTREKEKASDWVIMVDESIQLGQEKALVVLGVREKDIDFTRPLKYTDMVPLRIIVKAKSTGEVIKEVIEDVEKEIGKIKYAVGDMGNNIRKGLSLSGIKHLHDVTHKIALIIERMYSRDEIFNDITKKMTEMRLKYCQTSKAHIIPPNQRKKSRYLNIAIVSDWCIKALRYNERNNFQIVELNWLTQYKNFIIELGEINRLKCELEKVLKHKGFSEGTKRECNKIIKRPGGSIKKAVLKEKMRKYFDELESKKIKSKKLLISSDIIESAFGKYKNYLSNNPMAGITNLILCIAAFSSRLDVAEIKKALEKTRIEDIKKWTKEIIGKTLMQKRKEALIWG